LTLLVAADALNGIRIPRTGLIVAGCVVALAIAPNVAKLYDGRGPQRNDGEVGRTEYAMLDLARGHVDPEYAPGRETPVTDVGGATFTPLPAGDYLRAAAEVGSIGYPLSQIPRLGPALRRIADVTLIGALRTRLRPSAPPADPASCAVRSPGEGAGGGAFTLPREGALLGTPNGRTVAVGLSRFGKAGKASVTLAKIAPGGWGLLKIPQDGDPRPWRVFASGPIEVCR